MNIVKNNIPKIRFSFLNARNTSLNNQSSINNVVIIITSKKSPDCLFWEGSFKTGVIQNKVWCP